MARLSRKLEALLNGVSYRGMSRYLLALLRPYWRRVLPVLLLQGGTALLSALMASLVLPLLQVIAGGAQATGVEYLPGMARTYARWLTGRPLVEQLQMVAAAFVAVGLARSAVAFWSALAANRFTMRLAADLRLRMLDLYLGADYQFFLDRKQGRILNDLNEEPLRAVSAITMYLAWGQQFLTSAGLLVVLLALSWQATLVAAFFGYGLAIVLSRLRVAAIEIGKGVMLNKRSLSALGAESISGIRQIKLFGAEPQVRRKFAFIVEENIALGQRLVKLGALPGFVGETFLIILVGLIFAGLSWFFSARLALLLPTAGAFFFVLRQVMPILADLSSQRVKLHIYIPVLDFILSTFHDMPSERALRQSERAIPFCLLREKIVFEDVTFAYQRSNWSDAMPTFDNWMERSSAGPEAAAEDRPPVVFERLNLVFERGKRTALVGPSGVGKSTVVDLLVRLFDPHQGRITVDGVDLRDIDLQSWRAHIGYVSQDTFIFHGTIQDNIAFAKPDAGREEVERVARLANIHDFVIALPRGYDTIVGDRGMKLSGGQRQRLAIARALLPDPPILILDEATSALDAVVEQEVQRAIEQSARDRTVIVIAHRLSTIVGADMIYVMDRGRIVQAGQHDDLLRQDGHYAKLYRMRQSGVPAEAASAAPLSMD